MKVFAGFFVFLGLFLGPVAAFELDYGAVFAAHKDKVAQGTPGTRILELPGPVILREITHADGRVEYRGMDQSGLGAMGCTYMILVDLVTIAGICEGAINAGEMGQLEAQLRHVAGFMGENTVPKVAKKDIHKVLVSNLRERIKHFQGRDICPSETGGQYGVISMMQGMLRPDVREEMRRALDVPRLPVMNPCL